MHYLVREFVLMGKGERGEVGKGERRGGVGEGERRGGVVEGCVTRDNLQCGRCSYIQNEGDTVLGVIHSIDCMKGREGIQSLTSVCLPSECLSTVRWSC